VTPLIDKTRSHDLVPGSRGRDGRASHRCPRLGPITRLWHAVPSFPSISGVWVRLIEQVGELSVAPCRAAA